MKTIIIHFITLLTIQIFVLGVARAQRVEKLSGYFDQKISQAEGAVSQLPAPDGKSMELQDFNLDLSPSISFGISEIFNLTVSPEIDFVFTLEDAGVE